MHTLAEPRDGRLAATFVSDHQIQDVMNDSLVGKIMNRVFADFVMPSRLHEYRGLLQGALDAGYVITSIEQFWRSKAGPGPTPSNPFLILRHDVDTDPGTARKMFLIERDLSVVSSYYFRLSTIDARLMSEILDHGGEASYHYEELATVAKRRRPRDTASALALVPEAQDLFAKDIEWFRSETGALAQIVASHGDFVNRRLGVPNWVLLGDPSFRASAGVELETYDNALLDRFSSPIFRHAVPALLGRGDPADAIASHAVGPGPGSSAPLAHRSTYQRHGRPQAVVRRRRVPIARVTKG